MAENSGAVYVFRRTSVSWAQEAYIKASNTGADDKFGGSVAISGDTLVVGAWGESSADTGIGANQADNASNNSGAAYVFHRTAAGWEQAWPSRQTPWRLARTSKRVSPDPLMSFAELATRGSKNNT